jgi:4-hydroxy-tetrahydrodipicolinate synthase
MPRAIGRLLTAMVTPFDAEGGVDLATAADLARRLVAAGSDGVVVNGTTGESPTLSGSERLALLDAVRDALPEHAVLMGTGTNSTASTVAQTRQAMEHGADAALIVTPYYNKPPQEGLIAHYEAAADVGLPVVMYNIPSRCVVNMPASTQLRLAQHPNIIGTKESAGDLDQCTEIVAGAPSGFLVWSGDDSMTLPMLSTGAYGVVSVAAHVCGGAIRRMLDSFVAGDHATAARLHGDLLPLFKALFQAPNPMCTKAALEILGVPVGAARLPLLPLDAERREGLAALMQSLGELVALPAVASTPAVATA